MFKFFRYIRQRLLTEGKLSKYLIYAIGEIALVMIGILLALQVNNWNGNRKDAKLEQKYLNSIKDEFLLNITKLDKLDSLLGLQLNATNEFLDHVHPDKVSLSDSLFSQLMFAGFRDTYKYNPSAGVLKDLINSGKLNLITHDELRRRLADWEANVATIKEFEQEAKKASYDVVEILRTQGNFRNQLNRTFKALGAGATQFDEHNTDLLNIELFENSIVYFSAVTWRLKFFLYPELSSKMQEIITIVDEEIE